VIVYYALVAVIAVERLAELAVSRRHAAETLRHGGVESGRGHFPVMAALHAALLAGCLAEPIGLHRAFIPGLAWPMLALVVAANAVRGWCMVSLGSRWTARVIVIPGMPLVKTGPYRWFAHPNYAAVIVEGAALPLVGSAWITACTFTALNAMLLTVRVRCETRALAVAVPEWTFRRPPARGSAGRRPASLRRRRSAMALHHGVTACFAGRTNYRG
jgi:methyltransferase